MNVLDIVDRSNFPLTHPLYDQPVAKDFLYKSEIGAQIIVRAVCLKAKCYFLQLREEGEEQSSFRPRCKSTAKGVVRSARDGLTLDHYHDCIVNVKQHVVNQTHMRTHQQQVWVYRVRKVGLSSFDDKRFIYPCGIHTAPFGAECLKTETQRQGPCPFCRPLYGVAAAPQSSSSNENILHSVTTRRRRRR